MCLPFNVCHDYLENRFHFHRSRETYPSWKICFYSAQPWTQKSRATKLPAPSNILFPTTKTFPSTDLPCITSSAQSPPSPHTSAELASICEYAQPAYSGPWSHSPPNSLWLSGKVFLHNPANQDSGYGGNILEFKQRGTPIDKLHGQILGLPCLNHTISPSLHSLMGKARGTLPFGFIKKDIDCTNGLASAPIKQT